MGEGDREAELTSGTLILLSCAISPPQPLGKSLGRDEERCAQSSVLPSPLSFSFHVDVIQVLNVLASFQRNFSLSLLLVRPT